MVFNYDNPKIFLGQYPQFSCGQFLINCLSLGAGICPVATDEMILSWISQDNQVSKFDPHYLKQLINTGMTDFLIASDG
jgi:hypothetical protein